MARHNELRKRLAELEALASKRGGLDLSKLSAGQRRRYDEYMSANQTGNYEEILDRIADAPTMDADISRVLWGPNWYVHIEDTERTAADKYQAFRDKFR